MKGEREEREGASEYRTALRIVASPMGALVQECSVEASSVGESWAILVPCH